MAGDSEQFWGLWRSPFGIYFK